MTNKTPKAMTELTKILKSKGFIYEKARQQSEYRKFIAPNEEIMYIRPVKVGRIYRYELYIKGEEEASIWSKKQILEMANHKSTTN